MSGLTKAKSHFGLQFTVVAGAAAATNIAVTGIATEDDLIAVLEFATAASIATLTDRTSEASITSAGYIQCSSTSTANDALLVVWNDNSL